MWTVVDCLQTAICAAQGWCSTALTARVEHMFEITFDGKLAQLTGPLHTWAAQDLTAVPVAELPTDIKVLLRARNLLDGELLRRLEICDRSGEAARLGVC